MFKLVAVGGQLRGQEYIISQGENSIGRDPECSIVVDTNGISKRHMRIIFSNEVLTVEDLGSRNGTFVNGKLIKRKVVNDGDKLAIPGVIFQLVYVKEKKKIIKKRSSNAGTDHDYEPVPNEPIEKVKYFFRRKIMSPIYKINEEYEWGVMVAIFLALFTAINIGISIVPVLNDHQNVLLREVSLRAAHYADDISRLNAQALNLKDIDRVDTNFLNNEDGVASYELFDPEGRIVRPLSLINTFTSDIFSIKAREWAISKDPRSYFREQLGSGEIGIARRIKAYNPSLGYEELVGIIAIRFAPSSYVTAAANNTINYLRALALSSILTIFLFGVIYYLTQKPIEELRKKIGQSMRGQKVDFQSNYLFSSIKPIAEDLSSMARKIRELESDEDDAEFMEMEDEAPYLQKLEDLLAVILGPGMILDSNKNIYRINLSGEDLTGLRETAAQGENILDVAKEKGFAATCIEVCDQSANSAGSKQVGSYEISGENYLINCVALMGKDSFAKGFLITFQKEL